MTMRSLPEIALTAPRAEVATDIEPRALKAWNPGVQALAEADNVIPILDVIGEDFFGEGVTGKSVAEQLKAIGPNPVTVIINSPGGNFFEGLTIYNLLRGHPSTVTVQIVGIAASAASIVAMAGDEIQIGRAAMMMIHNAQWCACGDRHAMQEAHDAMAVFDEAMRGLYVDRTAELDADIGKMMDATTFLSSARAIELGFADELLEDDKTPTAVRAEGDRQPAYRLEAALAKAGMSRTERRRLLKEITTGMSSAAPDEGKPCAANDADEGLAHLRAAAMRLNLKAH